MIEMQPKAATPCSKETEQDMPRFKDHDVSKRLATAKSAKQEMMTRFRARPAEDDPGVIERKAARLATSQAREARIAEREAADRAKAEREAIEEKAREAEAARLALEQAEREAVERRAEADREVALLAEQKIARDARYAARKARR
jgi:Family of unknown function (DUF6481)